MIDTETSTLVNHVQELLKMRHNIEQLKSRKSELMNDVNNISIELLSVEKQFKEHKQVLDHCLLTGDDPVQVRLTMHTQELRSEQADRTKALHQYENVYTDIYNHIVSRGNIFKKGGV